jgi:hypothetical protein
MLEELNTELKWCRAYEYANLSIYDRQLSNLEFIVSSRLREGIIRQRKYYALLVWINKYRQLNIRTISPNHTNFPLEKTKSLDTMFELWILFELLDYLEENYGAKIVKTT